MVNEVPGVLACDVGNSAVHFAQVKGDEVGAVQAVRVGELAQLGQRLLELWQQVSPPRKLVASSVNPAALKALEAAAAEALGEDVLVIPRDLPVPIQTDLRDPQSVGVDRLCAAVAAYDRLGTACVVADFGTAITVDCVSDEGVFLGGAILPGLSMSADCLHERTAQLPRVAPAQPEGVFGRDTREAILAGILAAARGALRELVEAYATALGRWPLVIATGGDAELVCRHCADDDLVQAIVPDLAIRGVAMAYYKTLLT
ncbi:MAG TPA: type III pantothenate kinase [Phycisphaerae bacterium]|nr:type III pantothenate kinase [Phycisphaerae bacterium]